MFAPANQSQFDLTIFGRQHDFKVLAFSGQETLNAPYAITVELVSEQADLDLQSLLHQLAFLSFTPESTWLPAEGIHGQIYSIGQRAPVGRLSRYTLVLVPHLTYLTHSHNQRIFQNKTVPDIISQVLDDHNIVTGAHAYFELNQGLYPAREYCVQYGESDLHFIQRLCEEEGLHFHFRHSRDGHTLIFGDDNAVFRALDRPTPYADGRGMVADEPAIQDFTVRLAVRTTEVARRDYSFEKPHVTLGYGSKMDYGQKTRVYPDLEDYLYPGGFDNAKRGNFLADRSLERHRSDYQLAEGQSNQPTLRSGHRFELSEHSRVDWNDRWLLVYVTHEGKQPQALEELIGGQPKSVDGFEQGYRNTFTAIPGKTPYRPPLEHAKSTLETQTAKVTGPAGQEIYCDAHGRIKVQYHWDRADKNTDKSSCWLRVASGWAGQQYGAVTIPRVGTEVLVTFQEGDPDRPLVTGCLHHVENPVPYALPEHKTRSVFRSRSTPHTPGTSAFNELSIEDRAGHEKIFIQAERDLEQQIKRDYRLNIGNERQVTVKGSSGTLVEGRDSLKVDKSLHFRVGQELVAQAGEQIHLQAGTDLIIDAGASITLKAGGHHIVIGPEGIFSSTKIELGGTPMTGALANLLLPDTAGALVAAKNRPDQVLMNESRGLLSRAPVQSETQRRPAPMAPGTSELIAVAGSQHDTGSGNKMMFIGQAVRELAEFKRAKPDLMRTLVVFVPSYTEAMLSEARASAQHYGAGFMTLADAQELIDYLNRGHDRNHVPIEHLAFFSHGVPQSVAFGHQLADDDSMALDVLNYERISPSAFSSTARIDSYACRTGMGNQSDYQLEEVLQFFPQTNESLAQLLANHLQIKVGAFVRRSDYKNTWGSFEERQLGKLCGLSDHAAPSRDWCRRWDELRDERAKNDEKRQFTFQATGAINPVISGNSPLAVPGGFFEFTPK